MKASGDDGIVLLIFTFGQFRRIAERRELKGRVPAPFRPLLRWIHRRIRTALEYHRVQGLLAPNRELRDRHRETDRCFIIANGPSLKAQDLLPLAWETTLVMNAFHLHPDYSRIDPAYHLVVDPDAFEDTSQTIDWLRDLERQGARTTFLFPADAAPLLERTGLFRRRSVRYLLLSEIGCERPRIRADLTRPISGVQCVTLACLLVAAYVGFRNVYLLGCDHDWLATPAKLSHFYEQDPTAFPEVRYSYEELMESQLMLWRSYRHVRDFALARGVRIFNATKGGFLDVFPRVEYESLIAGRAPLSMSHP